MLAVEHLTKIYPDGTVALHDLSLEIADGEFFTLLGPSGSGKTTTLRVIAGFERPDVRGVRWTDSARWHVTLAFLGEGVPPGHVDGEPVAGAEPCQLVAVDEKGQLLGSASSLIIDWDDYAESAKWSAITGQGSFDTHNPLGKTLYGADMCVRPDARRLGIGSLFYEARKKMVRERGLKRLLTGGRIPAYAQVSQEMSPQEYVAEVVAGKRKDPTLSFQLANGLVVLDVVPKYLEDTDSRGFATLLEWLNPEYVTTVSLQSAGQLDGLEEPGEEARPAGGPRGRDLGRGSRASRAGGDHADPRPQHAPGQGRVPRAPSP